MTIHTLLDVDSVSGILVGWCQFHWRRVSRGRPSFHIDWQPYVDHWPCGWHDQLCSYVSIFSLSS